MKLTSYTFVTFSAALLVSSLSTAGPASAGQLFFEDFSDGTLGDDNINGGSYGSGYGTGGSFFATNPGRGVPNAFGVADVVNANGDGLQGWRWNAPSGGLSFDPKSKVLFINRTVLSDIYFAGVGEPVLFNMDIDGTNVDGGRSFYFGTGILQEQGELMRAAVWDFDNSNFQGNLAQNGTFTYNPTVTSGDSAAIDAVLSNTHTFTVLFRDGDSNGVTVETFAGVSGAKETVNLPAISTINNIVPTPDTTGYPGVAGNPNVVFSNASQQTGSTVQFGDVALELGVTDATDFNLDYSTDAQDLLIWNNNKFTNNTVMQQGDSNNDGATDAQDLLDWNNNKFTTNDLLGDETQDVADVLYDPLTGELTLEVFTSQVEAAIIVEVAEANVIDTNNDLPQFQGTLAAWEYNHFNGAIQLIDTFLLNGGAPVTPGSYVLAILATGLTDADFGDVSYGTPGATQDTVVTVIPEPVSIALLAAGALAIATRRRVA